MKKLLVVLVLIGVALTAGAYWLNHSPSGTATDEKFELTSVKWGEMRETVSATGVLQPQEVVAVGSELSGKVVEIYLAAEVNKVVPEGEPLLRLDDRMASIKLGQARVEVRLAEAAVHQVEAARDAVQLKVNKLRDLMKKDVGNQRDLDEADAQHKAADATVAAAKVKVEAALELQKLAQYGLDLTIVRAGAGIRRSGESASAPKRYTIVDRKVVLGQMIAPPISAQLFTLASDLGQMQVHTQVSENDVGKIRAGLDATFTVFAYAEENAEFKGKVAEIRPMPTNVQGAVFYDTVVDVANVRDPKTRDWKLRPGMTAAVDVILRKHEDVWQMPTAALSLQLDEHFQTDAAKAKLQTNNHSEDWKPVWIVDAQGKPWPIFARIGGRSARGETGIKESQYNEVLEWDPQLEPKPNPKDRSTYPQVITTAPTVTRRSIFDRANVKVF